MNMYVKIAVVSAAVCLAFAYFGLNDKIAGKE